MSGEIIRSEAELRAEFDEAKKFLEENGIVGIMKNIANMLSETTLQISDDFDQKGIGGPQIRLTGPVKKGKVNFVNSARYSFLRKQRTLSISLPITLGKTISMRVLESTTLIDKNGQKDFAIRIPVWKTDLSRQSTQEELAGAMLEGIHMLTPMNEGQQRAVMNVLGIPLPPK